MPLRDDLNSGDATGLGSRAEGFPRHDLFVDKPGPSDAPDFPLPACSWPVLPLWEIAQAAFAAERLQIQILLIAVQFRGVSEREDGRAVSLGQPSHPTPPTRALHSHRMQERNPPGPRAHRTLPVCQPYPIVADLILTVKL